MTETIQLMQLLFAAMSFTGMLFLSFKESQKEK